LEIFESGSKGPYVLVEPFPGNIQLIFKRKLPFEFKLYERALNAKGTKTKFFVPQKLDGSEAAHWNGLAGYSSTGHIPITILDKAKAIYRKNFKSGEYMDVEGVTLDEICRDFEHIRLIKTDLQGAEFEALRGAAETLRKYKTDIFILEFMGNKNIFDFFGAENYDFFAIDVTRMGRDELDSSNGFKRIGTDLSSTMKLMEYYASVNPQERMSYIKFSKMFGRFRTFNYCDLVVCQKKVTPSFLDALKTKNIAQRS
jgi:FkbM family methyltransferase